MVESEDLAARAREVVPSLAVRGRQPDCGAVSRQLLRPSVHIAVVLARSEAVVDV
jgi:hypothetical protein